MAKKPDAGADAQTDGKDTPEMTLAAANARIDKLESVLQLLLSEPGLISADPVHVGKCLELLEA